MQPFAFILTLVREALKDMEDIEGDEKFGCKTPPIVWGLMPD
jgi:4-hydroxybenzoate polyprenyltransferase